MADAFWGEIRAFGFPYAPQGWAYCWGSKIGITQNQALYAVIGSTYGGDNQTYFNLPDLRGRAPMNVGTGPGAPAPVVAGNTIGVPTVPLSVTQIPPHTHQVSAVQATAGQTLTGIPSATAYLSLPKETATNTTYDGWTVPPPSMTLASQAVASVGGQDSHSNISPYLTMNFCICIEGVFPSRS
jgi:microcystin-dependent protein